MIFGWSEITPARGYIIVFIGFILLSFTETLEGLKIWEGEKGRAVIEGNLMDHNKILGGRKGVIAPLSPRSFGPDWVHSSFIIWRGQEQGLLKDVRAKKPLPF